MTATDKKSILVIGGGSVGAVAALNLESGGQATVTVVLRSNYNVVAEKGYDIYSCDHGEVLNWKPSHVLSTIPDILKDNISPYDYIILATKNIPDISPVGALVASALPKEYTHTTLVLLQNGLNIEKPFLASHPQTPVLSGISLIGSAEVAPGHVVQDEPDRLFVGAFTNPNISAEIVRARGQEFVKLYAAGGKTQCSFSENVLYDRWKKLVYNASLNPICAITGLDTGRIRLTDGGVDGLLKPAMKEIVAAAKVAAGVDLGEDIVEWTINIDPLESYLKPSMQQDLEKNNFIEFENILGEPLREGKRAGVPMPTLEVLYQLARAIQWRNKERLGMIEVPKKAA